MLYGERGRGFFFAFLGEIEWCAEHSVQFTRCAMTQFLTTESTAPNEIYQPMQVVYNDNCVDDHCTPLTHGCKKMVKLEILVSSMTCNGNQGISH